jgi:hypothetical protein
MSKGAGSYQARKPADQEFQWRQTSPRGPCSGPPVEAPSSRLYCMRLSIQGEPVTIAVNGMDVAWVIGIRLNLPA